MVGKNNTQERFRRNATKDKRYTLKKLSVGLASVALGTVLFLNGAETVSAEAEVVDPNSPAAQPVQETFQFNYLNQATGARLDGFFGDYANANEAEKAFRHYANQHGYTLLNVRLEGHTFTADVAVEQDVQPEVEQEAQPAESTFQFIYRNKETGEKFDSFFGDYVNENEAEKDFRHYANQHGYTLLNVRLEGHTFTADVAVEQEAQPAESAFQFIYRDKETGEKFDSFFGDYVSENEAEKDFRHYANQHGYTLLNVRQNGHTFTADVARDSQAEEAPQTPEVEKGYSYALNFDGRTESANLGEFDSEEQAELALRIFANEQGYELSNLRLEGRTFYADAKVAAEADEPSESTDRYLQEAKDRARGIINGLENLFDTQKPSYLERIEDADSVAAVEAIVEEAQNYVNESKGGENGQATEEPEKPEYNQTENLVTYDLQITDQNGRIQTQRVTFPSRELALNYISQLVRSYEKAGVVLNEERSDVEGKDNTFILVFEEKQAEEPAKADYTVKVIIDGEERQSQALPDATRQEAIDYAERLANSYEQDGFTYNHLDAGLPSDTVIRIELSSPELDVPSHTEDAPAPEALDVTKAEALDIIAGLDLDDVIKDNLVYEINQAEDEAAVGQVIAKAYKIVAAGLAEEPTPELDLEEEAGRELDAAKAEALDAIAGLEHLSEEEKAEFVERINETTELGEVNRLVGLAFKRNIENFPEKTPELDPEEEAGRELDAAKAEALDAIAGLEYLSEEEKAGFVDRINETTELGEVNRLVGLAFKRNIENFPAPTPELDPEEEAGRELDAAKAEALDAIAGLEHLSEEEKAGFVDRINETTELGEVNRLVGLAFKRNIENFPESTPELDPEEEAGRELDAAKAEALDAIAGLEYLSEEEKAGFVDRINETTELGEVNRLVGLAFKRNIENFPESTPELDPEEEAGRELDAAKAEALEDIANLDYFTADEKQDLVDRINDYDNTGDIDFVVSKAIEENDRRHTETEAELKEAKDTLRSKIEAVVDDEDQKATFLEELEAAKTLEDVQEIEDLVDIYLGVEDAEELEEEKDRLRNKVASVVEDEADKVDFLQAIDDAKTIEDLVDVDDKIEESLEADADDIFGPALATAKEGALADIAGLDYYTADEKAELEDLVSNVDNVEDIAIIDEAISKAIEENDRRHTETEAELKEAKDTLRSKIEAVVDDEDQKATFLEELEAAKTLEDVQEIEDLVDIYLGVEDAEELEEEKDRLRNKVASVVEDEADKVDFLQAIDDAKTIEDLVDVDDKIEESLEADADDIFGPALATAKEGALADIAGLDYYTADEKAELEDLVNNVDNVEDIAIIDEAISKAIEENDRRHTETKQDALKELHAKATEKANEIDQRIDLTEEEKDLAHTVIVANYEAGEEAINNATTAEEVAEAKQAGLDSLDQITIDGEAKQDALKELHAKATEKANEIDQRIDLTEEEKDLAHTVIVANYEAGEEAINNATTAEEVAEAKQAGLDSLDQITIDGEAKQDALKELHAKATEKANEIDQRIDLTEEEKDLAHTVIVANYEAGEEAINNATTAEEVAEAKQAGLDSLDQITIDGEAKQDALKELHAKATEKANEIDQRIDLTEEEKDLAHTVIVANYEAGEEAINNATTAEEVAEAKQAGLDSLDQITIDGDSKQVAKDLIDSVSDENLNPKRKKELKDEIDRAESTDQIDEVIGKAEKEAEANALEAEKKAAKGEIDGLPLSTELVEDLKEQIDQAENSDEISSILESVDERALTEFKQDAQRAIDNVDNSELSPERKQAYKDAVEAADSVEEITDILDEANKESLRNYQALGKDLVDKVDDANLSPERKDALKAEIDQATTTDEVDEVIGKAEAEAEANALEAEKKAAKGEIDGLPLSTELVEDLKEQIDQAENSDEISSILESVDERALTEFKQDAQRAIDNVDNSELSPERKQAYKDAVEAADSVEEITDILDEANKESLRNYQALGKDLVDKVDDANLSPERKDALKAEIDQATTTDEVDEVIGKAEAEAEANALEAEKKAAKGEISNLPLSTELVEDLKDQIDQAENSDEISSILESVDGRALTEFKQDAVDNVDNSELSPERKQAYKDAVEEADSVEEITEILDEANKESLRNYQALGKDLVDKVDDANLSPERKDALKAEIDQAESTDQIDEVIGKAEAEAEANALEAEKKAAKDEIDALSALRDETKDSLREQIDQATTTDEIAEILDSVIATDLGYARDTDGDGEIDINGIHVAPDNNNRTESNGNPRSIDSTGVPTLPADIVKEDGDMFHFGENLPEGFKINENPKWHGVEEIVFEGEDESERILFRLNNKNGKVEVEAGKNASYDGDLLVKYVDADGTIKGVDNIHALIRPASPTDDSDETPPVEDSGSTDAGSGQGTGDQTDPATDEDTEEAPADEPKEPFNPSAVDNPVDILGSDSDEAGVSAGDHDQIKKGVTGAPEGSTLTIASDAKVKVGQDGKPRVDVTVTSPDGTETESVSVPVKQDLNKVVNNKLNDLATHANNKPKPLNKGTVTVKDQEKFRKYNETLNQKKDEIQKLLNDDANAEKGKKKLTDTQRDNLQKRLDQYKPVKTPKTEILVDRINGDAESKDVKNPRNRAVHLRVGVNENGEKFGTGLRSGGHGIIQKDEMNFGDGDDTIEVFNGIGVQAKVNLGNGNNELVIHGKAIGYTTFYNDVDSSSKFTGGNGIDTVTLTDDSNQQRIWDVNIPKFDRVNLNGTGGQFNVKYDSIVKHQLGGNGPLIVNGVAGKNNSVNFNYGNRSIENRPGSTFDVDGTWTAIKTVKKDGNTYVVWRNSKDNNRNPQHEVWVQDTLNVRY